MIPELGLSELMAISTVFSGIRTCRPTTTIPPEAVLTNKTTGHIVPDP
jgi:hypothetical protein